MPPATSAPESAARHSAVVPLHVAAGAVSSDHVARVAGAADAGAGKESARARLARARVMRDRAGTCVGILVSTGGRRGAVVYGAESAGGRIE